MRPVRLPLAALAAAIVAATWMQPRIRARAEPPPLLVTQVLEFALPPQVYDVTDAALDLNGNLIVAGITGSPFFPTTADAADRTCGTEGDVVVMVYSPRGALRYATCLGGPGTDEQARVAPSADGAIWVAASEFAFAAEPGYSTTGARVALWRIRPGVSGGQEHMWVGGPEMLGDIADLAALPDGSVWVLATAESKNITLKDAWQPVSGGGWDILVSRFAPGRTDPLVLTYLGGSGYECASALAVAPDGDAVVTGVARTADFPLVRPLQAAHGGGYEDTVLARVDASGRWIEYSTFLGGSGNEYTSWVAVGEDGRVFVAGGATSPDFPPGVELAAGQSTRGLYFATVDEIGRLESLTLIRTGAAPVLSITARPDGLLTHVGGYACGCYYVSVTDQGGRVVAGPVLAPRCIGPYCPVKAIASRPREIYIVGEKGEWPNRTRWVRKFRIRFPMPGDEPSAGTHDRR